MTQQLGFRCSELLHQEIKTLARTLGCSKTEAITTLIERGFEAINQAKNHPQDELKTQLNLITRLHAQSLCVINQIGDLAGNSVLNNAEQEYIDLLQTLGLNP